MPAALAALALAAAGLWYFFFRDDAPPPLTLEGAVSSTAAVPATTATTTTADPAPVAAPATTTSTAPPPRAGLDGEWSLDPAGSIVGYRIEEELAGIGGNTAVGRTSNVSGGLTLAGRAITAVSVVVDMTTLQSDDSRRDRQLRSRGLETNRFPEASFALSEPIDLGEVPSVGQFLTASARGVLTLHGVEREVAVAIEAQLVDSATIVVVGSVDVTLADYDIAPPTGFSVLSVADTGLFEFQLTFAR